MWAVTGIIIATEMFIVGGVILTTSERATMTRPHPTDLCRCGCIRDAHEHHRPGHDCGRCGNAVCPGFVPADTPPWSDPAWTPHDIAQQGMSAAEYDRYRRESDGAG